MDQTVTPDWQRSVDRKMGIDLFRLIGFIAVVVLHCRVTGNMALEITPRFAVPYFFIVAGYFLGNRPLDPGATLSRQAPRLLTIYFACFVFYIALHMAIFPQTAFKAYIRFLLTGGPGFHLWFLPALLVWTTAFAWAASRMKTTTVFALAGVLYAVGLATVEFRLQGLPYWICLSGPSFASIFIAIGFYIKRYDVRIGMGSAVAIAAGGWALQLCERLALLSFGRIEATMSIDYYLGTIPFAVGIFLVALNFRPTERLSALAQTGRFTLGFYIVHVTYIWLFELALAPDQIWKSAVLTMMVATFSIASVFTLLRLGVNARYLGG